MNNTMYNKYQSHRWIIKVIKSCETDEQVENCKNLIKNFQLMYDDEILLKDLEMHLIDKTIFGLLNFEIN
jgi:hypothetical protein